MEAVSQIERQRAIAWIVRQLTWERTLDQLREGRTPEMVAERAAA